MTSDGELRREVALVDRARWAGDVRSPVGAWLVSQGSEAVISADQLVAHAFGDYVLQSDWMAREKTRSGAVALIHALFYSLPFLLLRPSLAALALIVATHAIIDRYRLARFVVFAKNFLCPAVEWPHWSRCGSTGYPPEKPQWMAVWLLIFADNALHVLCNGLAMRFLP